MFLTTAKVIGIVLLIIGVPASIIWIMNTQYVGLLSFVIIFIILFIIGKYEYIKEGDGQQSNIHKNDVE